MTEVQQQNRLDLRSLSGYLPINGETTTNTPPSIINSPSSDESSVAPILPIASEELDVLIKMERANKLVKQYYDLI
jgi:hypothetical protein